MPPKTQTLWCKAGAHAWERPAQRGRKPIACPVHVNQTVEVHVPGVLPGQEKLHCEIGDHNWTRPKGSRGRKPSSCPNHAPKVAKPAAPRRTAHSGIPGEVPTETLHCEHGDHDWERPIKKGKKPESCPQHSSQTTRTATPPVPLAELQRMYQPTDEDVRVITYIDGELARGRNGAAVAQLQDTRAARVRSMRMRRDVVVGKEAA